MVNGTANSFPIFFKMDAGIRSGPVAFVSSRSLSILAVYRDRSATNCSISSSGPPKKGQSTASSGNFALASNVFANRFAFSFEEFTHFVPSRKGGIDEDFVFFYPNYFCFALLIIISVTDS